MRWAARLMLAVLAAGCAHAATPEPSRQLDVLTSLPLFWEEGGVGDALSAQGGKARVIHLLETALPVRPLDTLSPEGLANSRYLMLAQPRRLGASELVALDDWVMKGGRLLVFADPLLVWPSLYPLGDSRRPPPVTLLDPLFRHWGVTLGNAARNGTGEVRVTLSGHAVTTTAAGRWTGSRRNCLGRGLVLTCRIGRGQAILVADADLLDSRHWGEGAHNETALLALIEQLKRTAPSTGSPKP